MPEPRYRRTAGADCTYVLYFFAPTGCRLTCAHRPDYITAFCLSESYAYHEGPPCTTWINPPLAVLIFHAPRRVKDAFYYQMSTVYALLITCSVSLFQGNITRLHATIAIFIASSPVSIYFLVYSIKAFWGAHLLDAVLGKKDYLNRGLVFLAVGVWISIVIYTSLGSIHDRFAQGSCPAITEQEVLGVDGIISAPSICITAVAVLSWTISIVLARKEIWPPGERYRPKFVTVW